MASHSGDVSVEIGGDESKGRKHDSMEPCDPLVINNLTATEATISSTTNDQSGLDHGGLGIFASDSKHDSLAPLEHAGAMAQITRATRRKSKATTMYLDPQTQQDFQLTQLYLTKYGRPSVISPEQPARGPPVVIQTQELEDGTDSVWAPPFAFEEHLSPEKPTSITLSPRSPFSRHQSSPSAVTPSSQKASPVEDIPTWTPLPPRRPYTYKSLVSRSDIRLLTLTVSELDGKLYFQLPRQSLHDCPPYEAVSYTWGGRARTKPIYHAYSGDVLYVTENCEAALMALHDNGNRRLWVDAICINQNDLDERSAQVAQMADVFRNAFRTVIYLGGADEHSAALVRWPRTRRLASGLGVATERTASERAYIHAEALLQRPWFTRTWIIQEVLLSRDLLMQAGQDVLDISEFSRLIREYETGDKKTRGVMDILHRYGSELSTRTRHAHRIAWRDPNRQSALESIVPPKGYIQYWQLFDLLMETRDYGCQDPRDKLYALISLLDGDPPSELVPDYSLSVEEVYANISRYLIVSEGTTIVLCLAQGTHYSSPFPTWAIDWRTVSTHRVSLEWYDHRAGFLAGQQQVPALPSAGNMLQLRGIKVAVVHLVLGRSRQSQGAEFSGDAMRVKELDWLVPLRFRPHTPTNEIRLPDTTWPLDVVCVFIGFEVPFILRQVVDGWLLVGECYIEGLMHGEAVDSVDWSRINDERAVWPLEDFNII